MNNSAEHNEQPERKRFTRRGFLKGAVAAGISLAVGRKVHERLTSPEMIPEQPDFIGFNTHLHVESQGPHDLSLDVFKKDIEAMTQEGMNMVRFNILPGEVAASGTESGITWNETNFAVYKDAIRYAKQKGLQVILVANTPEFANSFSDSAYTAISREYFSRLAGELGDDLYAMQLFNEANVHNFRTYAQLLPDQDYLTSFSSLVGEITQSTRAVNPELKITANVGGWPLNDGLVASWEKFFTTVSPHLDFLSLDMYPDTNQDTIARLDDWVKQLQERFQKDIMISEIGLPTAHFSVQEQGLALQASIQELKKAHLLGILVYEYRDEAYNPDPNEASFGVVQADGTPKDSLATIVDALQPAQQETFMRDEKNERRSA